MTLFRFTESRESRRMTANPLTQTNAFTAAGTSDNNLVAAYATAATPAIVTVPSGILYRQDISVDPIGFELWKVTVPYATRKQETGDYRLTFDTTGGTIHLTCSKETISSYPAGEAPNCEKLIGVNGDQVEGADVIIPALKINVHFTHPAAIITLARMKYLAYITGMVNSDTFLTFEPGEALFLGASGSEGTDAPTEVTYQFAMSANTDSLTIGEMANIVKAGHHLVWIKYKDAVSTPNATALPVKQPEFAYVERVYEETDLALALGFG